MSANTGQHECSLPTYDEAMRNSSKKDATDSDTRPNQNTNTPDATSTNGTSVNSECSHVRTNS